MLRMLIAKKGKALTVAAVIVALGAVPALAQVGVLSTAIDVGEEERSSVVEVSDDAVSPEEFVLGEEAVLDEELGEAPALEEPAADQSVVDGEQEAEEADGQEAVEDDVDDEDADDGELDEADEEDELDADDAGELDQDDDQDDQDEDDQDEGTATDNEETGDDAGHED